MNVQEIMTKVYQLAGEPSDLCPYTNPGDPATFDFATAGAVALLSWVNQAVMRIANWEYPDGTILRHRALRKTLNFIVPTPLTGLVLAAGLDTLDIAGFPGLNRVGQFDNWIVEITGGTGVGQKRFIVNSTGAGAANVQLVLLEEWATVPDTTSTYALYRRHSKFVAAPVAGSVDDQYISLDYPRYVADVLAVQDLLTKSVLEQLAQTETLTSTIGQTGVPSMFTVRGDELLFDVAPTSKRVYQLLYYAHPAAIAAVTDRLELSAPFHEAVVQWAVHSIQMREQDFNGAYATKRDLQELMSTLRLTGEMEMDMVNSGVSVWGG